MFPFNHLKFSYRYYSGWLGGWVAGWVAGEVEIKAISVFNWVEVEVEVEVELGKIIHGLPTKGGGGKYRAIVEVELKLKLNLAKMCELSYFCYPPFKNDGFGPNLDLLRTFLKKSSLDPP